ncbi:hypothetical protein BB560_005228 [Smittium megazygosporum]|uniref:Importin N-terminal domain-containing protein n=1 Tax=Smittium megazygosporum TaxID=133381 RepID=A0A2T9Z774_9FUNG|nr:hypothetical protein BB560_005228 [Smittium megazygosporum]
MSQVEENIANLLQQTLSPNSAARKQAENLLSNLGLQKEFSIQLLSLITTNKYPVEIRTAATLYFKNFIKKNWEQDENKDDIISYEERLEIKKNIISILMMLPPNLQLQLNEAISTIADCDFPAEWPNLIKDLVSHLSSTDFVSNNAVLATFHSIFNRYRSDFRSDLLFSEIKYVISSFFNPYFQIFLSADQLLSSCTDLALGKLYLEAIKNCVIIYYDLNCQDLPELFEDNLDQFTSLLHKYLVLDKLSSLNPVLSPLDSTDDDTAGILEEIKTEIFKVVYLYTNRYEDVFTQLPTFLDSIWNMLINIGLEPKYDSVSISLPFLFSLLL